MGKIGTSGIVDGQVVYAEHVLRIINALTAVTSSDILINANLYITGSSQLYGTSSLYGGPALLSGGLFILPSTIASNSSSRILVQDPTTGLISYMYSSSVGSNSGSFSGSFFGDGTGLTGVAGSKWTGSTNINRLGNVQISGSLVLKGIGSSGTSFFQVTDNNDVNLFQVKDNGSIFARNSITGSIFSGSQFTGSFFGIITSASSGLNVSSSIVKLGGPITEDIDVNATGHTLVLGVGDALNANRSGGGIGFDSQNVYLGVYTDSTNLVEIGFNNSGPAGSIVVNDFGITGFKGMEYSNDLSANFGLRSLVDKGWVLLLTSSFWSIGGNSFGGSTTQSLGTLTNDNFSIITSGSRRLIIASNGTSSFNGNVNVTGSLVVSSSITSNFAGTTTFAGSSQIDSTGIATNNIRRLNVATFTFTGQASSLPVWNITTAGTFVQSTNGVLLNLDPLNVAPSATSSYTILNMVGVYTGSASGSYRQINMSPNYGTGLNSISASAIGIDYNPTGSNISGSHFAALFRTGSVGIGTGNPSGSLHIVSSSNQLIIGDSGPNLITHTYSNASSVYDIKQTTAGTQVNLIRLANNGLMTFAPYYGVSIQRSSGQGATLMDILDNVGVSTDDLLKVRDSQNVFFKVNGAGRSIFGKMTGSVGITPSASLHIIGLTNSSLSSSFLIENNASSGSFTVYDNTNIALFTNSSTSSFGNGVSVTRWNNAIIEPVISSPPTGGLYHWSFGGRLKYMDTSGSIITL